MTSVAYVFTVHCPSCRTGFPVDADRVPDGGVHAVCSECLRVFAVTVPDVLPEVDEVGEAFAGSPVVSGGSPPMEVEPAVGSLETEDLGVEDVGVEDVGRESALELEERFEVPWDDATFVPDELDSEGEAAPGPGVEEPVAGGLEDAGEIGVPYEVGPDAEVGRELDVEFDFAFDLPEDEEDLDTGLGEGPVASAELEVQEVVDPPAPAPLEDLTTFADEVLQEDPKPARGAEPPASTEVPSSHSTSPHPSVAAGAARFGRRDPSERARHLARVLVSDIIAYHPVRYRESFARGTLQADFREEVEKSWKEYVDQVGLELAESTPFFREALNDVLGQGQHVF